MASAPSYGVVRTSVRPQPVAELDIGEVVTAVAGAEMEPAQELAGGGGLGRPGAEPVEPVLDAEMEGDSAGPHPRSERDQPGAVPAVPGVLVVAAIQVWERWLCDGRELGRDSRVLALEGLVHAAAPALSHGLRHRIGEDVVLVVLHSVEDGARDRLRRGLG